MTTNVTDLVEKTIACDSRWSIDSPLFVIYIDDTGFDKIVTYDTYAFMFAGNGRKIQEWKDWILSAPSGAASSAPDESGIALCIVNTSNWGIEFERGQDIEVPGEARFAGSGSMHAHTCWKSNRNARLAVDSAKLMDVFSGGEVKYLDSYRNTNVNNSVTVSDVEALISKKGMVMYKTTKPNAPVAIDVAAANDPSVKTVLDQISTGASTVNAPCDSMHNTWSDSDKNKLRQTLTKIFG